MLERTDQPTLDRAGTESIECGYRNASDRMVIVRCCGPQAFYLERVVFPFELLSFHCPPQSELEIWTHGLGGPELIEVLRAEEVRIEAAPMAVGSFSGDGGDSPWWLQAS
jgi:hypothetical protein